MRHRVLIFILALGTVAGYACGFTHLGYRWHGMHTARERHWAQICADAARRGAEHSPPAHPADETDEGDAP